MSAQSGEREQEEAKMDWTADKYNMKVVYKD